MLDGRNGFLNVSSPRGRCICLNEMVLNVCVLLVVLARTKAINKENRVLLFFFSLTRNLKLITVQIHVATLLWNVVCNRIQFTI